MRAAVLRYRVMAYVTGVVLVILCFVGVPLQVAGYPAVAHYVGVVHGILYIIYLLCAWQLARMLRLAAKPTVIMLLAGTVPIMTFIVERWVTRRRGPGHRLTAAAGSAGAASAGLMNRRVTQRSTMNVMIGIVPASSMITVGLVASLSFLARIQAQTR